MPLRFASLAFVLLLGCSAFSGCAGGGGTAASGTRYGVWYTPSRVKTINGFAIGAENSGMMWDTAGNYLDQTVNGISIELFGTGLIVPLGPLTPDILDTSRALTEKYPATVNGIAVAGTGTLGLGTVNGAVCSLLPSWVERVNGISAVAFINDVVLLNGLGVGGVNLGWKVQGGQIGLGNGTHVLHGLQVGVFLNTSDYLHGMQIGLVNISHRTRGTQIGLYNWGGDMAGVQIGVVNRVGPTFKGLQLGLLNIGPPGVWPLLSVSL